VGTRVTNWRSKLLNLVAVASILAGSTRAYAQLTPPATPPNAEQAASAKKHFDLGLKLYNESAFQEALTEFTESYRLGGRASALKNAAQCYRDLKKFVEAFEAYEQILALHDAQLKEPDRVAVKKALEDLKLTTGTVKVVSTEPGADVKIDGKSIGSTPQPPPKRVGLGPHKVEVSKVGFETFVQQVEVASQSEVKVDAVLKVEVTTGHVSVKEKAGRTDVHVFVDGVDKGPAPWEGDLAPGDHAIEARGTGVAAAKRIVSVTRQQKADVVLEASSTVGRFRIKVIPESATILVDGTKAGEGSYDSDVPVGHHRIQASAPGFETVTREMSLDAGQSYSEDIKMVPAAAPPDPWPGLYARFALAPTFFLGTETHPGAPPTGTSQNTASLGGGAVLNVGYALKQFVSFEGTLAFMADTHTDSITPQGDSTVHFKYGSVNGFVGAGGRVTSHTDVIRFTFGASIGAAIKNYAFATEGAKAPFDGSGSYVAPGFLFDGGILLGSTPGVKFFLGGLMWIDFPGDDVFTAALPATSGLADSVYSTSDRKMLLSTGTQVYVGPMLGVQFGH
jgi:hypothetical protein